MNSLSLCTDEKGFVPFVVRNASALAGRPLSPASVLFPQVTTFYYVMALLSVSFGTVCGARIPATRHAHPHRKAGTSKKKWMSKKKKEI